MKVGVALLFQNVGDLDRYEAAERGDLVGPIELDDSVIMRDQLALGDLVEPLRFDTLWTFEHRASPYIMLPAPQQFIAYFAARTNHIGFGTMVTVVPWHDPIRLAESLSLLTHMVGPDRRLVLGIGRGLARREYASLGIDMNESRQRFSEGVEILRRAFHEERFSFDGEVYHYEASSIRPRPLSTDIVEDIYGVWTSEDSMEVAASLGLHALTIPSKDLESYKADLDGYDARRETYGHGPAKPPIIQLFMYCNEDGDRAREVADRYFGEYADSASRHYEFGGSHFEQLPSYRSYQLGSAESSPLLTGSTAREAALGSKARLLREGLVGTPEQCVARVEALNEMLQPAEIVLVSTPGSMPAEMAADSLRLFSEQALPAIRTMQPAELGSARGGSL
jgi:alkanesulfonate monooxygenase SsuD/methylene tetrahydromethanopterin reductase-like flavin-dependent oxidoreductase (luciferase family)